MHPNKTPKSKAATAAPTRESILVNYIYSLLNAQSYDPNTPIPKDLQDIEELHALKSHIYNIREFISTIATGQLEFQSKEKGYVASRLKTLQANLLHLKYQLKCVGNGEFDRKTNFLGDFSDVFNEMADQLHKRVSTLETTSQEYQELSCRDALTALYNRFGLFRNIEKLLFEQGQPLDVATLIIADIDHFKRVNDTYGHTCGDDVLKHFASKLLASTRTTSLACRYGGEEFLIFMPETPLADGLNIAERLRKAITAITIRSHPEISLTASFGLVEIPLHNHSLPIEDFLRPFIAKADENLYKAKNAGRNLVIG